MVMAHDARSGPQGPAGAGLKTAYLQGTAVVFGPHLLQGLAVLGVGLDGRAAVVAAGQGQVHDHGGLHSDVAACGMPVRFSLQLYVFNHHPNDDATRTP